MQTNANSLETDAIVKAMLGRAGIDRDEEDLSRIGLSRIPARV